MRKVYFAIALHFHQPTGNFENIFERAHALCYGPFFEVLSGYPGVKCMVHVSGCLLDYLEKKQPKTVSLLKGMVSRGQIELIGGAYYEPILTAIPPRDAAGQVRMMTEYIKRRFDFEPKGVWIAERVWDPGLVDVLCKEGLRYLILDDEHLLRSGVKKEDIHGCFLTGEGRNKIAVFPSDERLRYGIPFKPVQETIEYLKSAGKNKKAVLFTYGDDGEKFGEWPGTHKLAFEDRWLRDFFEALQKNSDWLELTHFSDYLKGNKPETVSTVRQGSYKEMMEWSGGCWLNFLSKYPETNQMHKKMLYVSSKVESLKKTASRNDAKKAKEAVKQLYKGQCNCGYWHGVFGGLYLYHLRYAVYNHLIESEKATDAVLHKSREDRLDIKKVNFYNNGKDAYVMENRHFFACIDPDRGGVIRELDLKPFSFNLVNTLSRRREAYHRKIAEAAQKKPGAEAATIHGDFRSVDPSFKKMLVYDRFTRSFLRTYLVRRDISPEDFMASSFGEIGDFAAAPYAASHKGACVSLKRRSGVSGGKITIDKKIRLGPGNEIEINCFMLREDPSAAGDALLGVEFNVTMPQLNAPRYAYCLDKKNKGDMNSRGAACRLSSFGIADLKGECGIEFRFSKKPEKLFYFPVQTISQSERAYELNYQCSCIFPMWKPEFDKKGRFDFQIRFASGATT